MTQAIGLVSLVLLLAFSLTLLALGSAAVRTLRAGDLVESRGPLAILAFLALTVPASFFTWANSLALFSLASINALFDGISQAINANPVSWVCLGPLAVALIATMFSPVPRKWIAENYFSLSVVILVVAIIGAIVASLILLGGSWSVLAAIILFGVAVGLGNQGLVFIPHLNDGPRVGENLSSALPRIAKVRARRGLYQAVDSLASAPQNLFTKDAAVAALIVITIAAVGLAYKYRPVSPVSAVSSLAIATPVVAAVSSPAIPLATPTPARALTGYKIANTNNQGVFLREQPSQKANPIVSLAEGATVQPAAAKDIQVDGITWRQVKDVDGKFGWTSTQFLEPVYSYGMVKVQNGGGDGVYVRAKAGLGGNPIGVVHDGDELRLIGPDAAADGKTWRNVGDTKGMSGWVASDYLAPLGQ